VAKTDGVLVLWEELTKMFLESGLLRSRRSACTDRARCPAAIPTTLHDSLMARLDLLSEVKGLAQLGPPGSRVFL